MYKEAVGYNTNENTRGAPESKLWIEHFLEKNRGAPEWIERGTPLVFADGITFCLHEHYSLWKSRLFNNSGELSKTNHWYLVGLFYEKQTGFNSPVNSKLLIN